MKRGLAIHIVALLVASAACGQSPPTSDDIIVIAAPDQHQIDRQIYTVKNNAQAQAESGLDVLKRVPSVTVNADAQQGSIWKGWHFDVGAISMRGDRTCSKMA